MPETSCVCIIINLHLFSPYKDQAAKDKVLANMSTMSSSQIVSATAMQNRGHVFSPGITGNPLPMHAMITSPGN